jgi:hypothetical protein
MFNRNSNATFLGRMLAGLVVSLTIVLGSLGHAVSNSQAFL